MAQLSDVMDPLYLEGLETWTLDRVRARRDEATETETGLSYLRRIVQGRLDIVVAERRHRDGGKRSDVSELVDELPAILSESVHAPGRGRLPTLLAPGEVDAGLQARLEEILPAARLSHLDEIEREELGRCTAELTSFERRVSSQRRAVFDVLDRLQEEVVRRYCSGEATVDSLLS